MQKSVKLKSGVELAELYSNVGTLYGESVKSDHGLAQSHYYLKCLNGPSSGMCHKLTKENNGMTIGKAGKGKGADVMIDDETVSPQHALIQFYTDKLRYCVTDLSSKFGTWMKLLPFRGKRLFENQEISLNGYKLKVSFGNQLSCTEAFCAFLKLFDLEHLHMDLVKALHLQIANGNLIGQFVANYKANISSLNLTYVELVNLNLAVNNASNYLHFDNHRPLILTDVATNVAVARVFWDGLYLLCNNNEVSHTKSCGTHYTDHTIGPFTNTNKIKDSMTTRRKGSLSVGTDAVDSPGTLRKLKSEVPKIYKISEEQNLKDISYEGAISGGNTTGRQGASRCAGSVPNSPSVRHNFKEASLRRSKSVAHVTAVGEPLHEERGDESPPLVKYLSVFQIGNELKAKRPIDGFEHRVVTAGIVPIESPIVGDSIPVAALGIESRDDVEPIDERKLMNDTTSLWLSPVLPLDATIPSDTKASPVSKRDENQYPQLLRNEKTNFFVDFTEELKNMLTLSQVNWLHQHRKKESLLLLPTGCNMSGSVTYSSDGYTLQLIDDQEEEEYDYWIRLLPEHPSVIYPDDIMGIGGSEFVVQRYTIGIKKDQGRRPTMEDEEIAIQDLGILSDIPCSFFAVYDGHGGWECASFVKHALHRCFRRQIIELCGSFSKDIRYVSNDHIHQAIRNSFTFVDREFLELWEGSDNTGCAAVIVVIIGNRIWCANSGDARAVLSNNGVGMQLSLDHKPNRPDELERIVKAGGFVKAKRVLGRLAVSRAFGDREFKGKPFFGTSPPLVVATPEIRISNLNDDSEFLLVACDGLFDVFTTQEAVDFIKNRLINENGKEEEPQNIVNALIKEALVGRGGKDNVSAILVVFENSKKKK